MAALVGAHRAERPGRDVSAHHRADRRRAGGVVEETERLGRPASHDRRRVGERRAERRDRVAPADEAEGKRAHLPHFLFRIARQSRGKRRDALREADSSDAECRAPSNLRGLVGEQRDEVGRRRWRRSRRRAPA
jgi:hypothetical protein